MTPCTTCDEICPVCGGKDLDFSEYDCAVECENCGATWVNHYIVVGYDNLEEGR